MSSDELFAILVNRVQDNTPHRDYQRTVDHATWCHQVVTGDDQRDILVTYKVRETQKQVEQRIRITNSRTQYVANKVKKLYNEVHRCDDVTESITYTEPNNDALLDLQSALNNWYENKPLKKYIANRFKDLVFEDPNAYIITEFENDDPVKKKPTVYPFEVRSSEVYYPYYVNGVLQYLITFHPVAFKTRKKNEVVTGYKYTMYGIGHSFVMQHIPKDAEIEGYEGWNEMTMPYGTDKKQRFFYQHYDSRTEWCPAFRVGFADDPTTQGRTKVSPLYPAEKIITDLIWNKSEYDLSKALHGFYQKFMYVDPCKPCSGNGYCDVYDDRQETQRQVTCDKCKGTGKDIHSTVQDIILRTTPDSTADMIPLRDMIYFAEIPASLITMQREDFTNDQRDVFNAIFGANVLDRSELVETATAKNYDWRAVNNTLFEYADQVSEFFKHCVRTSANHLDILNGLAVNHSFPSDFKLESIQEKIDQRASATAAGLPQAAVASFDMDIMAMLNKDDPEYIKRYKAWERFKPMRDKSKDERMVIMSMLSNDDPERILWIYYERIMADIFDEKPQFPDLDYKKQKALVYAKVEEIRATMVRTNLSSVLSANINADQQEDEEDIPTDAPIVDENDPQVKLRGSVGGVSGIVQIASAVADGTMTAAAGETIMIELYGLDPAIAKKIVSVPPTQKRAKEAAAVKATTKAVV